MIKSIIINKVSLIITKGDWDQLIKGMNSHETGGGGGVNGQLSQQSSLTTYHHDYHHNHQPTPNTVYSLYIEGIIDKSI